MIQSVLLNCWIKVKWFMFVFFSFLDLFATFQCCIKDWIYQMEWTWTQCWSQIPVFSLNSMKISCLIRRCEERKWYNIRRVHGNVFTKTVFTNVFWQKVALKLFGGDFLKEDMFWYPMIISSLTKPRKQGTAWNSQRSMKKIDSQNQKCLTKRHFYTENLNIKFNHFY